jgi:nitrite reductase/ring-hydroxylating ferredoxin subunit
MGWSQAASLGALPEGRMVPVEVGGELLLLLREGEAVRAFAALCPHKSTLLSDGTIAGGRLHCPLHDASFDLATGEPGPGQHWAGRLPVYATRVEGGMVEVDLTAPPGAAPAGP